MAMTPPTRVPHDAATTAPTTSYTRAPQATIVLRAALLEAIAWMWDPAADATAQFEWVATEFYRDTGHLRPGKSDPMQLAGSPEDRAAAWEVWRRERARNVLATMRAALAATEEK